MYHLLIHRLDKHFKLKKNSEVHKQELKVEIIKKATLSTENFASITASKLKKFSFRGRKIDANGSHSQPMIHEINNNIPIIDVNRNECYEETNDKHYNDGTSNNEEEQKKIEEIKNEENIIKNSRTVTSDTKNVPIREDNSHDYVVKQRWKHKRSSSSADRSQVRNSLTCDPQIDFNKPPETYGNTSPTDSFLDVCVITARKQSFDGLLDGDEDIHLNSVVQNYPLGTPDVSVNSTVSHGKNDSNKNKVERNNSTEVVDDNHVEVIFISLSMMRCNFFLDIPTLQEEVVCTLRLSTPNGYIMVKRRCIKRYIC